MPNGLDLGAEGESLEETAEESVDTGRTDMGGTEAKRLRLALLLLVKERVTFAHVFVIMVMLRLPIVAHNALLDRNAAPRCWFGGAFYPVCGLPAFVPQQRTNTETAEISSKQG